MKRHLVGALFAVTLTIAGGFALVPVLAQDAPPTCGGKAADVIGTTGDDTLVITKSDAVVITNGGKDTLSFGDAVTGQITVCQESGGDPDIVNMNGGVGA